MCFPPVYRAVKKPLHGNLSAPPRLVLSAAAYLSKHGANTSPSDNSFNVSVLGNSSG